jgi:protein TonB
MEIAFRHWSVAIAAALVAHAGVAVTVLWKEPPSGAKAAGLGGIEISLGPMGGAPGDIAAPESAAKEIDPVTPSEVKTAQPVAPVAEEVPVPVETVPIEPSETGRETPPAVVEPARIEEARPVEIAEAVPVRMPPPKRKPKRKVEEVRQVRPAVPDAVPPPDAATPIAPPVEHVAASTPSVAGAGGRAGAQASTEAGGSVSHASGGGLPGQGADYMSLLQAWLEKHKKYPRGARARRQEGTALLYFVMDRDGGVGEYRIERSSGYPVLDREVLALLDRAKPLPAPPPEVRGSTIKLIVPVQFFLR